MTAPLMDKESADSKRRFFALLRAAADFGRSATIWADDYPGGTEELERDIQSWTELNPVNGNRLRPIRYAHDGEFPTVTFELWRQKSDSVITVYRPLWKQAA